MTDDIIPEDARRFFLGSVDSIAQWEGLLLLRAAKDQGTTSAQLAQQLYIDEHETSDLLSKLVDRGIIERADGTPPVYRYRPRTKDLDELIEKCAQLYRAYLIPVTTIIHSNPKSRVQEFANAFRLRKD